MLFDCVVEITPENYFLCLDFDVKKSIFRKCKPKLATTTTKDKHSPSPPTQNLDQEEGKNCHHYYVATTTHKKSTITHPKSTKTPPRQQQNQRVLWVRVEERVWFLSEGTRSVTCSVRSSLDWLEGKRENADRWEEASGHGLDLGYLSPWFLRLGVS